MLLVVLSFACASSTDQPAALSLLPLALMQQSELDDLVLLRASTRPTEFRWHGTQQEEMRWEEQLKAYEEGSATSAAAISPISYALLLTPHIWLNVQCRETGRPELDLQGPSVDRDVLEQAVTTMRVLEERAIEEDFDNPIFEVYTGLQASLSTLTSDIAMQHHEADATHQMDKPKSPSATHAVEMQRVIFWSHHLKAPSKKRDINKWCAELDVFGLVKSGYPGFLCFEGERDGVEEMVRRIKALQWHAITVKTDVHYEIHISKDEKARSQTLLQCKLATGHSCIQPKKHDAKLRLSMDEVQRSGELVKRLRDAGIAEEEILFALNLRS